MAPKGSSGVVGARDHHSGHAIQHGRREVGSKDVVLLRCRVCPVPAAAAAGAGKALDSNCADAPSDEPGLASRGRDPPCGSIHW